MEQWSLFDTIGLGEDIAQLLTHVFCTHLCSVDFVLGPNTSIYIGTNSAPSVRFWFQISELVIEILWLKSDFWNGKWKKDQINTLQSFFFFYCVKMHLQPSNHLTSDPITDIEYSWRALYYWILLFLSYRISNLHLITHQYWLRPLPTQITPMTSSRWSWHQPRRRSLVASWT